MRADVGIAKLPEGSTWDDLIHEICMRQAIAVIEKYQHFTEWIITTLNTMQNDIDLTSAEELLRLGRQLTRWKWRWREIWQDEA